MNKENIKKGRHSRTLLPGISLLYVVSKIGKIPHLIKDKKAGDPRLQHSGMTAYFMKNHAFTLIELLVVVLIIGILAAVALPQYQIAVEKARAAEALVLLKSLKEAKDVYQMANSSSTVPALDDLDINIPGTDVTPIVWTAPHPFHQTKFFQIGIIHNGNPHALRVSNGSLLYTLAYYYNGAESGFYCNLGGGADGKYTQVCKALGGVSSDACQVGGAGCFKLP